VDVTGFDRSAAMLSGRVAAARAFGTGATVENGERNGHGTAAASVVAQVAPEAELYLAKFEDEESYATAVAWLLQQDVDVIVAPVSFYGQRGDGSARSAAVAQRAVAEGTVFVAPVGNLGRGHWSGEYAPVADGRLQFAGGTRNFLSGGRTEVTVWLSWDETHAAQDYTVELYRATDEGETLVARSQPYPGDDVPNERIRAEVQGGVYFLEVRGPANATGAQLELTSPTHRLQYARPAGSVVAPATAPGVLSVGAFDRRTGRVMPFSSQGPTTDGRLGVDVVAPGRQPVGPEAFVGSSAAAPYAGGVAALVLEATPSLSPRRVETLLEATAVDVGPRDVDFTAGHGRVDPQAAVRAARNETG
jgi:subtilisin family serine protease